MEEDRSQLIPSLPRPREDHPDYDMTGLPTEERDGYVCVKWDEVDDERLITLARLYDQLTEEFQRAIPPFRGRFTVSKYVQIVRESKNYCTCVREYMRTMTETAERLGLLDHGLYLIYMDDMRGGLQVVEGWSKYTFNRCMIAVCASLGCA